MNKILSFIKRVISSNKFYYFVIGFFIFESLWIALSAKYPQAFDENFHFGLIKLYSKHLSPLMPKEPQGGYPFGVVFRDPSYLYHYLMSFPYRLIEKITSVSIYQVVSLRIIDIVFFGIGIILFRKVLVRVGLSKGLANLSTFLFTLIPIVPQLAGQINYDDLLFMLIPIIILLSLKIIDQLKKKIVDFKNISVLMILCTLTSLVKYAFLPIYLGIIIFFISFSFFIFKDNFKQFFQKLAQSFLKYSLWVKILLIFLIALSLFLFIQRDIYNLVEYGSIQPSCSKILTLKECNQYYVWKSDHARHLLVLKGTVKASQNPFYYTYQWFYWMWYRLFFAINGPKNHYINYPPLPLPSAGAILVAFLGLVFTIRYFKKIFYKNYYLQLFLLINLSYLIALFIQGYVSYQYTGVLENMNGRYLIPILFTIFAIFGYAYTFAFKRLPRFKIIFVLVALILFIEGGGVITYIVRSDDSWYINSSKVRKISKIAKKIVKKTVIKGKKTYETNIWFFN